MKKIFILFAIIGVSISVQAQDIIIKDINIISMTSKKVKKKKSVLIKNGKIEKITSYRKLKNNTQAQIIEGKGKYLMPGLADMHVHLPAEEQVDQLLQMSVAAGITHIRVMNNDYSQVALKKDLQTNPNRIAPRMHYSHLIKRSLKEASVVQIDSIIGAVRAQGLDFIKLYSVANETVYDNLMASANKNDMIVCGHYPRYVKDKKWKFLDIEKVLKSNLRSIEHVGGYQSIRDEKQLLDAVKLTKKLEIYNCPTFDWAVMKYDIQYPSAVKNRLTYRTLPKKITSNWAKEYSDAIEEAGGEEKVLATRIKRLPNFEKKKKVIKLLYENDCLLLVGSDAGGPYQADGFNLWEEMKNWSDLGIDNYTILKSATINAAKFFKQEDQWGSIEKGKNADLVILDKNPIENIENITTIKSTIIDGKVFKQKEILETI